MVIAYDALVAFAGCDKSLPGMMMAMLRLNVTSIFVYGGSILPGSFEGRGVAPAELPALARAVGALPRLTLRGLMAVPERAGDLEAQRRPHRALRSLLEALRAEGLALDMLSMGMSADLEAAVLEGATIVRVGTAIIGARG